MQRTSSVKSRILKQESIRWKNLKFIQDDNFKEWDEKGREKLQESILKYQFADPFKVWENNGEIYCLDGKHRYLDLVSICESGINVPDKLPATFIDCKNKNEAAELVLVYSSHYAKITKEGLIDFSEKFTIDLPEISGINLSSDLMEQFEDLPFPEELTADKTEAPPTIKITFLNSKQLSDFEKKLEMMQNTTEFEGISYSVSQGEL